MRSNTPALITTTTPGVLGALRSLVPQREAVTFTEALRVAEFQAARLLDRFDIDDGPVPTEIVSELPRVQVVYADLPVSGTSHWNGHTWVIAIARNESRARQRFTLMHEFKHVLDHGHAHKLYRGPQSEQAADYFAGCALVPRRLLKRAWGSGVRHPADLARHFGVSIQAITVRLAQTGLALDTDRCDRPVRAQVPGQTLRTVGGPT